MTNIMQLMKQAKEMQSKMEKMQAEMAEMSVEGEAGAGLIKITINGRGEMKNISIDPSLIAQNDLEMLEDLIVAGFNDAKKRADDRMKEETGRIMNEIGLPPEMLGGGGFPF